jgi:hypothetical protein
MRLVVGACHACGWGQQDWLTGRRQQSALRIVVMGPNSRALANNDGRDGHGKIALFSSSGVLTIKPFIMWEYRHPASCPCTACQRGKKATSSATKKALAVCAAVAVVCCLEPVAPRVPALA